MINEEAVIRKLSLVSLLGNAILSGFKLFAGIFGHSGAMISDAIHSLSDVFTTLVAWIGVKVSKKQRIPTIPTVTNAWNASLP